MAEAEVLLEGQHVALVHDGLHVVLVRVGRAEESALVKEGKVKRRDGLMVGESASVKREKSRAYRVTEKNLQNLLLAWFRQFRQLVGRYYS